MGPTNSGGKTNLAHFSLRHFHSLLLFRPIPLSSSFATTKNANRLQILIRLSSMIRHRWQPFGYGFSLFPSNIITGRRASQRTTSQRKEVLIREEKTTFHFYRDRMRQERLKSRSFPSIPRRFALLPITKLRWGASRWRGRERSFHFSRGSKRG